MEKFLTKKLKNYVLSMEQCKNLREAGLSMTDASLCWRRVEPQYAKTNKEDKDWNIESNYPMEPEYPYYETIPTYTLQEIYDKLPKKITDMLGKTKITQQLKFSSSNGFYFESIDPVEGLESRNHRLKQNKTKPYSGNILEDAYLMLLWVTKFNITK